MRISRSTSLKQGYVRFFVITPEEGACVMKKTFKGDSSKEVKTEQIVNVF